MKECLKKHQDVSSKESARKLKGLIISFLFEQGNETETKAQLYTGNGRLDAKMNFLSLQSQFWRLLEKNQLGENWGFWMRITTGVKKNEKKKKQLVVIF